MPGAAGGICSLLGRLLSSGVPRYNMKSRLMSTGDSMSMLGLCASKPHLQANQASLIVNTEEHCFDKASSKVKAML